MAKDQEEKAAKERQEARGAAQKEWADQEERDREARENAPRPAIRPPDENVGPDYPSGASAPEMAVARQAAASGETVDIGGEEVGPAEDKS